MNTNTKKIRYFLTVARLQNMTKAAELLEVSQSSLSKDITLLENELGTELFNRSGKKLTLNVFGQRFLESCLVIVDELDKVSQDIEIMVTGFSNQIKLCIPEICPVVFDSIAQFKKKNPNVSFQIDNITQNEFPDINYYDMIVYPDEKKYEKFRGIEFYEEKYYLAVNSKNELAEKPLMSSKSLNGLDFVFVKDSEGSVEYPYEICRTFAINMKSVSFVPSRDSQKLFISSGTAVGFVPKELSNLYGKSSSISLIPLTDSRFARKMKVCFKREKHISDLAKEFKEIVEKNIGER